MLIFLFIYLFNANCEHHMKVLWRYFVSLLDALNHSVITNNTLGITWKMAHILECYWNVKWMWLPTTCIKLLCNFHRFPLKIQQLLVTDCKQLHYWREITWILCKLDSILFTHSCLGTFNLPMLFRSLPKLLHAQHYPDMSPNEL